MLLIFLKNLILYLIMKLEDLLGIYYVYNSRTKSHGQEYILEFVDSTKDKIKFIFQTIVSGNFGSSGIIWKGNCRLQNNQLYLNAVEKNDWSFTALQEEKEENIQKTSNLFNFEILKDNNNLFLISVLYEKTIKLHKLNKNIDKNNLYSIAFGIIHEIMNRNELRKDPLEFEPSRFWRISNLLLKSYNEIKINEKDAFEIICEYDLEYVKEEKRVVENDEILAEHHVDKVIFNQKNKIMRYKTAKFI